jgi:hypothetical protein
LYANWWGPISSAPLFFVLKDLIHKVAKEYDVGYSNLQSTIKYAQGKLFLAANIRGRLGTMPVNWSVSAARPRLDHFSLSEAQSEFEK